MLKRDSAVAIAGLCLAILWSGTAFGQEAGATPLSLKQCIEIALNNQSAVLIGENGVTGAKAAERQAKGTYFPQVSAQRTGTRQDSNVPRTGNHQDSGTISVTQNFYDGGLREATVGSANAKTAQSELSLLRARQTAVFDVTQAYFALLQAMRLQVVQDESVKYFQGQLDMIKTRIQIGDAAEVDSLPVEAQLANARVSRLSAENAVRTAAIKLQSAMGLSPAMEFAVQEDDTAPDVALEPVETYIAKAMELRPEIRQTMAGTTSARYSLKAAKISLLPRPTITGSYNDSYIGDNLHTMSITGGFVYDLFDGGINRAKVRSASAGLSNAEIAAAQTKKDVRSQVQQAWLNVSNAKERMKASDVSLAAAKKNYEVQESRYKQGLAIPLDLLNAELSEITAKNGAVQSRYDYLKAIAQLEYATGMQGAFYEKK